MTIAIVIGTHGWAAEQLLKTAEMLLGEQENVGWIDFVPGENAETLIEKYNAQLAKLDTSKGKSITKLSPASISRCWWKPSWPATTILPLMNWSP